MSEEKSKTTGKSLTSKLFSVNFDSTVRSVLSDSGRCIPVQ